MSDKTVKELAEMVKIPLDRFMEQLKEAGVTASAADDLIDEDERVRLLAHLRKRHGKAEGDKEGEAPKKITLKRRKVTELKQATGPGVSTKTVNVEVRKKKTYIKRDESVKTEELKEIELAKKALEEQKKQIAAEEEDRKKHELNIQATLEEKKRQELLEAETVEKQKQDETKEANKEEVIEAKKESVDEGRVVEQKEAVVSEETTPQEQVSEDKGLSEEELKAKKLEAEKKARLEASIERNAAKVRKQAEAKKQQTLHKKKQVGSRVASRAGANAAPKAAAPAQKRGLAPGRGAAMPTGTSRRAKGKKGKQKRIQLAAEHDTKHQFEMPVDSVVRDVNIPETIIVSELAQKMSIKAGEVIKELMKLGIMATINQTID
ncbi:MAG: translation initiation factor IF-2 N-terminal domain-containing protein, partial [Methylococcales bacterium]|nr:translation initiation factor IF-2 N-terminal domain-containing protein [Methylococcales bacterium]